MFVTSSVKNVGSYLDYTSHLRTSWKMLMAKYRYKVLLSEND